jgi:hypothetical protein
MENDLKVPIHSHCINDIELHDVSCEPMDFYNIKSINYKKLVDWNEIENTISFDYEHIIVNGSCEKEKYVGSDTYIAMYDENTSQNKINRSSSFNRFGQNIPYYFVQDSKHNDVIKYYASEKMPETTSEKSIGLHTNQFTSPSIVSHTFENGVGTIKLSGDITKIPNYAFYGTSFSYIEIPNSVTSFGYASFGDVYSFSEPQCDNFIIPDSVITFDNYTFYGKKVKKLYIGSQYGSQFEQFTIQFGYNVPIVTEKVTVNLNNFKFYPYSSSYVTTEELIIGDNVTSIGNNAVNGYKSFTNVVIPNSVTSIGDNAFYGCSSLESIDIPDSVITIGVGAFEYCTSLSSCTIGSGVTSIGSNAFGYCSALTSITVNAVIPPTLGAMVFDGTNNCSIYVPSDSVDAYKSAPYWSNYASRIQAMP